MKLKTKHNNLSQIKRRIILSSSRFFVLWARIELFLVGALGTLALLVALYVMITRYIFPEISIDWGEEVIVYLLVWAMWISSSQLVAEQGHVKTDLIFIKLPTNTQHWLNKLHQFIGLIFSFAMTGAGLQVVWFALIIKEKTESSLHFPLWIYYLAIPCGCILMGIHYSRQLITNSANNGNENS